MIDGVSSNKLSIISTPGEDVLHVMKNIDNGFVDFGEAYFSEIEFDKVKAWKRHTKMTLNLVVPVGRIKFVLFDDRMPSNSIQFQEIKMSRENYFRLTIPPMIWVGFQGLYEPGSLLLNIADIPHNPDEVDNKSINEIDFDWSL